MPPGGGRRRQQDAAKRTAANNPVTEAMRNNAMLTAVRAQCAAKATSLKSEANFAVAIKNRSLKDAQNDFDFLGKTITYTASPGEVGIIENIKTVLDAKDSTEDNYVLKADSYTIEYTIYSGGTQFRVVPFVAILENGETITETEYAGSDLIANVETNQTGTLFKIKYATPVESHIIFSNGNPVYIAHGSADFTPQIEKWLKHKHSREINEETTLELILGYSSYLEASGQSAYFKGKRWCNSRQIKLSQRPL